MSVEVVAPGLLTTIQDVVGRPNLARLGVAPCGALDPCAAATANLLVDNPADAALLEATLVGPTLRFSAPTAVAVCGADLGAMLDGSRLEPGWSWLARSGATLSFGERRSGARAYIAFGGGVGVEPVLGARAADVRADFDGLLGRPLRGGDVLPINTVRDLATRCGQHLACPMLDVDSPVRILPGPHLDRFEPGALEALCATTWQIGDQADRMGYRLVGPRLRHAESADVASLGLPIGTLQVPGDGRPIVLLADHQPTGGYAVIACVIRADVGLLAQRAPGDSVRFALTTRDAAQRALRGAQASIHGDNTWDYLRLAGAHR